MSNKILFVVPTLDSCHLLQDLLVPWNVRSLIHGGFYLLMVFDTVTVPG